MKQGVLVGFVLVVSVLAVQVGTVGAVAADSTGLGFNTQGQMLVDTGRNVFVPLLVLGGLLLLAAAIGIGLRVAGVAVRWIVMCILLIVVCTGAGLTTFFPGLITSVTLP